MVIKKSLVILLVILFFGILAFSVFAQEATSTPIIIPETATTTTTEIVPMPPAEEPAPLESSTPLTGQATSTEATSTLEQAITTETAATTTPEIATTTPEIISEIVPTPPPPVVSEVEPSPPAEPAPQPAPSPVEEPTPPPPAIDSATAPSKVTIRVIMSDGSVPPFPVFVTFVGVGNKNFGGKINANGELTATMPQGRYYTELLVISTEYVQGEDGPSFFLEANEERDFGVIRLMPKANQASQTLEDSSLEANILQEAESAKGIGKILVLIVKLLIKILEEVRAIASTLSNR